MPTPSVPALCTFAYINVYFTRSFRGNCLISWMLELDPSTWQSFASLTFNVKCQKKAEKSRTNFSELFFLTSMLVWIVCYVIRYIFMYKTVSWRSVIRNKKCYTCIFQHVNCDSRLFVMFGIKGDLLFGLFFYIASNRINSSLVCLQSKNWSSFLIERLVMILHARHISWCHSNKYTFFGRPKSLCYLVIFGLNNFNVDIFCCFWMNVYNLLGFFFNYKLKL